MKEGLLIILSGGGDTVITLAPLAAKEWIESSYPENVGSYWKETIPPAVMQGFEDEYEKTEVGITIGSGDNDRAMHVQGWNFDTVTAAMQFAAKNKIEVCDEYHGYLY